MKQGTLLNRVVMLVLLCAILLYIGVYAWNAFTDPFTTVLSYAYTVDDGVEATGFLVREETVIPGVAGSIVDLTRSEGEKVSRGESVAMVYQSSEAAGRRQQIHALELELEQLQYSLDGADAPGDSARLSQEVINTIVTLRAAVAAGDLTRLEDQTMDLKSLVYKRDATYGDASSSGATLQESIASVTAQLDALMGRAAQDTSRVTVDMPGIFSGQADGYESLLTPSMLTAMKPSELTALAGRRVEPDTTAIGKLITDSTWYFICPISAEDGSRFIEGKPVTARFSRDWSGEVSMRVEQVSDPENGKVALLLSTDRFLSETTLLRRQTVDLVFSSTVGIRVPMAAVRVGEDGTTGVFALVGNKAEYKPVEVLAQRDDYCIVLPVIPEGSKEAKKALRAGDEIIVAARDLFDGMVVR